MSATYCIKEIIHKIQRHLFSLRWTFLYCASYASWPGMSVALRLNMEEDCPLEATEKRPLEKEPFGQTLMV